MHGNFFNNSQDIHRNPRKRFLKGTSFRLQVPSGLVTELGITANKRSIYSSKASPPPVQKAYLDQFTKDFTTFLRIHSKELFSRGRMLLTCICKVDEFDEPNPLDLLDMAINDLIVEVIISLSLFDDQMFIACYLK